jgi:hypothetical protein
VVQALTHTYKWTEGTPSATFLFSGVLEIQGAAEIFRSIVFTVTILFHTTLNRSKRSNLNSSG